MTPDELRKLADEATCSALPRVDARGVFVATALETDQSRARLKLNALAPDLARLCAELGEALELLARGDSVSPDLLLDQVRLVHARFLAKLSELKYVT